MLLSVITLFPSLTRLKTSEILLTLLSRWRLKSNKSVAWCQLYQISKIKSFLTVDQLKTVTVLLVLSFKAGPEQLIYSGASWLSPRQTSASSKWPCSLDIPDRRERDPFPFLASLHCLLIQQRIKFKLLLLVYKCLNGIGPSYLSDFLSP